MSSKGFFNKTQSSVSNYDRLGRVSNVIIQSCCNYKGQFMEKKLITGSNDKNQSILTKRFVLGFPWQMLNEMRQFYLQ